MASLFSKCVQGISVAGLMLTAACGPLPVVSNLARCSNGGCDEYGAIKYLPSPIRRTDSRKLAIRIAEVVDNRKDKSKQVAGERSIADGMVTGRWWLNDEPSIAVTNVATKALESRSWLNQNQPDYEISIKISEFWMLVPFSNDFSADISVRRLSDGKIVYIKTTHGPKSSTGIGIDDLRAIPRKWVMTARPDVVVCPPDDINFCMTRKGHAFVQLSVAVSEAIDEALDNLEGGI